MNVLTIFDEYYENGGQRDPDNINSILFDEIHVRLHYHRKQNVNFD